MSADSLKQCRVCGEEHDLPAPSAEHPVTVTMDDVMARRMLVGACWANEWALVDALVHALTTGEETEVPDGI